MSFSHISIVPTVTDVSRTLWFI